MESTNPKKLEYITTEGRRITTNMSDHSEYREQMQMICFLVIVFGFLFAALQFIGFASALGHEIRGAMQFGGPLMIYSSVVLLFGMVISWRKMSEQTEIKIVELAYDGIVLGNKKYDSTTRKKIPWSEVEAFEIVDEVRSGQVEPYLYIATRNVETYKLRWCNAFAWVEPELLLSELKTNAPNAMVNIAQGDIRVGEQSTRYTNLWLQYFSSPDTRTRRGVLTTGTELNDGRYRVLKRLGGGGQGTIYLASAKSTDLSHLLVSPDDDEVLVVVKEYVLPVHRGSALADKQYDLLNHEAQILGHVKHLSIVRLLDCFVEDNRGYIVLEYFNGETLKALVAANGPLDESAVLEVIISICDILSYLHSFRPAIIHRDLTPDNLMCNSAGEIMLIDFTVAHQLQSTRTATVVGKQAYIPVEQFRGHPQPQSDIYALGCTMYFLLTGSDPAPMQESDPRVERPEISMKLSAIVKRATAFDVADRYGSADELKADLERALK